MKFFSILFNILLFLGPTAALAQVPSYAEPVNDQAIKGRVAAFDGQYSLQVRDEAGYVDNVALHQGTIINPTGLTLAPGMVVNIYGYPDGGVFEANEIDTPYTAEDGGWYYDGHPWDYYVGPAFGIGFFFGDVGWWHRGYYGGWHGSYWHGGYGGGYNHFHNYNSVHINSYHVNNYRTVNHPINHEYHGGERHH